MGSYEENEGVWGIFNYIVDILHAQVGTYDSVPNWIILK